MELIKLHLPERKGETYIMPPAPITEAKKEAVRRELHRAAWAVWNSISVEERLKMNLGVDLTKILQRKLQALLKAE